MHFLRFVRLSYVAVLISGLLGACISVPKDYVPDEEVVYLRQQVRFEPIYYTPSPASPYEFQYTPQVNKESPAFLNSPNLANFLVTSFQNDVTVFHEVKAHLLWILEESDFVKMREQLKTNENTLHLQNGLKLQTDLGTIFQIEKDDKVPDQHQYHPAGKELLYVVFYKDDPANRFAEPAMISVFTEMLRFNYSFEADQVSIMNKEEMVFFENDYHKEHHSYNYRTNEQIRVLSYFLPEGIRLYNLGNSVSSVQLVPNWPVEYSMKEIGPFQVLYTVEDEKFLNKLDQVKLQEIVKLAKKITMLKSGGKSYILFPPNLEAYGKLHSTAKDQEIHWYPSGFLTKGIIFIFPPSLPKYKKSAGRNYYWSTEIYDTILHEYVHKLISDNTRYMNSLPVWLHEGMALLVESEYSEEAKAYWETTYLGSRILKRKLDWDDVTIHSTGEFEISVARVHYAQSYKMVRYLYEKYGAAKLSGYVGSFSVDIQFEGSKSVPLKDLYKKNFKNVFGLSWDDNIKRFEEYVKNGS